MPWLVPMTEAVLAAVVTVGFEFLDYAVTS